MHTRIGTDRELGSQVNVAEFRKDNQDIIKRSANCPLNTWCVGLHAIILPLEDKFRSGKQAGSQAGRQAGMT